MITWDEFKQQALSFYNKSVKSDDSWEWSQAMDRPGFGFLMKRKATILSHDQHSANDAVADESAHLSDIDEIIEIEDEAALQQNYNPSELHIYDIHIVYSTTYQQPVLYFNCYTPDGKPLPHVKMLDNMQKLNGTAIQPYISQKEHPVLGKPYFHLHPCETAKLMTDVLNDYDENQNITRMKIPLLYFK